MAKRGRKPKSPPQRSQEVATNTSYGSYVPFLQIGGRKVSPPKPDALLLRNFSKTNPIIRRCINIIKDKLVRQDYSFTKKDPLGDYADIIGTAKNVIEKPNNTDDRRSFFSAVIEDLVSGDCGAFEVVPTGNPYRPVFLYPTDGYTVSVVLNDNTYGYAQRVTKEITGNPENYIFFLQDEMMYLKKQCFTNNPYGLSPIECAFEYIKALTQTFTYSSDIASNALPKYLANIKGIQSTVLNEYKAYFQQECMGVPVLPMVSAEDVQSVQIAPISEEATFMGYQQFVIAIIALAFGIPPEKLAIAKSNDRSKISEINENLLQDCIKPYADVIESAMNRVLGIIGYDDRISFGYIYADTLEQQQIKQGMAVGLYQADIVTRNEVREMLGLPPSTDDYAEDYITIYKAKVNEEFGIQGFGDSKAQPKEVMNNNE